MGDQPLGVPGDAPARTPPRASRGITIREPAGVTRPIAQVGTNVASSSQPEMGWQTTFKPSNEPLLLSAGVRTWSQGEGGRVAQSLVQGLQLPEDVHFF